MPQVIEWVGITIASGITGNAAYELVKAAIKRNMFARRRFAKVGTLETAADAPIPTTGPKRSLMDYTARAAIVVQCKAHDLPVPAFADLRVGRWRCAERDGRTYHEATVRSRFKSPFSAEVRIPTEDLDVLGVNVVIHQAITWDKKPSDGGGNPTAP